ncbi:hypothetical protein [Lactobacillus johnsonii]|uniref:hypothetical protein n=1 Tax=Lactobacillus johnsonii TaxID=33959 RepID=UPI0021A2A7B8|nr:hypothetical protein [Lactobacillus johnsonii]
MPLIPFLVAYSKPSNDLVISKKVDDNSMFWFPIIAGIATKQELERATMEELQIYNEVAKRKIELMGGADLGGE